MSITLFDLDQQHIHDLVRDLAHEIAVHTVPPKMSVFRTDHQEDRELLDWLKERRYIRELDSCYVPGVACALTVEGSVLTGLPNQLERVFEALRRQYEEKKEPYEVGFNELCALCGPLFSRASTSTGLLYLSELGCIGVTCRAGAFTAVSVKESILDAKTAMECIRKYRVQWRVPSLARVERQLLRVLELLREFNRDLWVVEAKLDESVGAYVMTAEVGRRPARISIGFDDVRDLNACKGLADSMGGDDVVARIRLAVEPQLRNAGFLPPAQAPSISTDEVHGQAVDGSNRREPRTVFVIHGHDEANLECLRRLLEEKLGLTAIILRGQPHMGRFILEKFEDEAKRATYAFALLTPDDVVTGELEEGKESYRQARPNVVFELGWFYRHLGRPRVCILMKRGTFLHTDLTGIGFYEFDKSVEELADNIMKELHGAGVIVVPPAQPRAKIEIRHESRAPYVMDFGDRVVLHRIAVKNTSQGVTIRNVRVALVNCREFESGILPVTLHLKDDNRAPLKESFDLSPDEDRFIDVIQDQAAHTNPRQEPDRQLTIQSILGAIGIAEPKPAYHMNLKVTAEDTASQEATFKAYRDVKGRLQFERE